MRLAWGLRVAAVAAAGLSLAILPFLVGDYRAFELGRMGIFFIAILGLNLLTGYTGQVSIGHGAFMAVGGYTSAILATRCGVPDYLTIPLGGLTAGLAGLLFGLPALRLRGLYLALATFGVAVAMPSIAKHDRLEGLTKGTTGINLPELHSGTWLYGVTWAIAAALFLLAFAIVNSRLGRAFRALRDSEVAASSMGVNPAAYKVAAFGISSFYAGVAGSLYALSNAYVNPDVYFVSLSLFLLIGAVIGGLGSLTGVIAGAAFVQFVPPNASSILDAVSPFAVDSRAPGVPSVILGAALVLVVLLAPTGAGGLLRRISAPLMGRLYTRSEGG